MSYAIIPTRLNQYYALDLYDLEDLGNVPGRRVQKECRTPGVWGAGAPLSWAWWIPDITLCKLPAKSASGFLSILNIPGIPELMP